MALPHPDVNAVLRFPAKLGTSHKKAPQNLFKTPFAPSNFPLRRHTAAPHVFLRRAGRLCPPKHTPTAPALCPYPVIPSQCSHWRGNPHPPSLASPFGRGGRAQRGRRGQTKKGRLPAALLSACRKTYPVIPRSTSRVLASRREATWESASRARRRGTPPASLCEAAQCSHWVVRSEA